MESAVLGSSEDVVLVVEAVNFGAVGGHVVVAGRGVLTVMVGVVGRGVGVDLFFAGWS